MILPDSSAWIEYLRATGSRHHHAVRELTTGDEALATTDVVAMELLAGVRNDREKAQVETLLYAECVFVPLQGLPDYEAAAELYRRCRRQGKTIRRLTDCLIAVVAIRAGARVLHSDADFDAIAACSDLEVVT